MKKTFSFGKVDFGYIGRKINAVEVTIELKDGDNGSKVFSASGAIWNASKTDCVSCGQNLNTISKYVNDSVFKEIYDLWNKYHLNDLNAGTRKQTIEVDNYFNTIGLKYDYTLAENHLRKIGLYFDKLADDEHFTCKSLESGRNNYGYGTGWLTWDIPSTDIERIEKLLSM